MRKVFLSSFMLAVSAISSIAILTSSAYTNQSSKRVNNIHPVCDDFIQFAENIVNNAKNTNNQDKVNNFNKLIAGSKVKIGKMSLISQVNYCSSGLASLKEVTETASK